MGELVDLISCKARVLGFRLRGALGAGEDTEIRKRLR